MIRKKLLIFVTVSVIAVSYAKATMPDARYDSVCTRQMHPFAYKQLIVPVSLMVVGSLRLVGNPDDNKLVSLDHRIRDERMHHIKKPFRLDDYTQYSPMVAVYVLNVCGVKGRHNFRDRTVILATSNLLMVISVSAVKYTSGVPRPFDPPGDPIRDAFPSGHTATAFMAAEYLRMEYKDVSPWYGFAGYTVAVYTGLMRVYNDAHWLSDVIAGAGFGMLSTKTAYWIYPSIQRALFKKTRTSSVNTTAIPFYYGKSAGFNMCMTF